MLVLSRRQGEAIYIGDNVVVKIAEINGTKVRLAIQAPDSVRVDREEVHMRRQEFARALEEIDLRCVQPAEVISA